MQVLRAVEEPFREKGYGIAMHGSVPKQGEGNDLDLVAIPKELAVPPPEEMERVMCKLLDAQPLAEEPRADGLLRTWCRACILPDGRQIDVEYLRPVPPNLESETVSSLANEFWKNGYFVEFHSYGRAYDNEHDLQLLAIPARSAVTPPKEMEGLMCRRLDAAPIATEPGYELVRILRRACVLRDGRKISVQYRLTPAQNRERR